MSYCTKLTLRCRNYRFVFNFEVYKVWKRNTCSNRRSMGTIRFVSSSCVDWTPLKRDLIENLGRNRLPSSGPGFWVPKLACFGPARMNSAGSSEVIEVSIRIYSSRATILARQKGCILYEVFEKSWILCKNQCSRFMLFQHFHDQFCVFNGV
jgi:hypothetical protein